MKVWNPPPPPCSWFNLAQGGGVEKDTMQSHQSEIIMHILYWNKITIQKVRPDPNLQSKTVEGYRRQKRHVAERRAAAHVLNKSRKIKLQCIYNILFELISIWFDLIKGMWAGMVHAQVQWAGKHL